MFNKNPFHILFSILSVHGKLTNIGLSLAQLLICGNDGFKSSRSHRGNDTTFKGHSVPVKKQVKLFPAALEDTVFILVMHP